MPELKTDEAVEKAKDESVYVIKKSYVDAFFIAMASAILVLQIISAFAHKSIVYQTYMPWFGYLNFIYIVIRSSNAKGAMKVFNKIAIITLSAGILAVEILKIFR